MGVRVWGGGGTLVVFPLELARCEHDASMMRGTCLQWGGSSLFGLPALFGSSMSPFVGRGVQPCGPLRRPSLPVFPSLATCTLLPLGASIVRALCRHGPDVPLFLPAASPPGCFVYWGGGWARTVHGTRAPTCPWSGGAGGGGGGRAKYMHVASTRGTLTSFPWDAALYPRLSGRCCPLAVVATSPQGVRCPVPAPSCAHTYWRRCILGWKRKMRKCGQRGGLTVRLEGFLRHPLPSTRGGPLCRHPTARGGLTAHPVPGACVSISERPDTGAVVSVRWKWRLQSGRALSSPGPLPPPSAMVAPEVLWQRRGETGGGFICGIP